MLVGTNPLAYRVHLYVTIRMKCNEYGSRNCIENIYFLLDPIRWSVLLFLAEETYQGHTLLVSLPMLTL
jgi:hypothetical protein